LWDGKYSYRIWRQLLDEINILVSPLVIGGSKTPALFQSPELRWREINPKRLALLDYQKLENDRV